MRRRVESWTFARVRASDFLALSSVVSAVVWGSGGRCISLRARSVRQGSRKLKGIFRGYRSQLLARLIEEINPILHGWVQYFAIGHSSRCFSYIRDWVEKRSRRHLGKARQRRGFGWKRWSKRWLYERVGLFNGYRLSRLPASKAAPV